MPIPEHKRYSPLDRAEVHRDMQTDPVATARSVAAQPAVAEAHRDCAECATLLPARAAVPSRVGKVRLTLQQVVDGLNLPPGHRAVRMYASHDPQDLFVVIEGDGLEPVPPGQEAPVINL